MSNSANASFKRKTIFKLIGQHPMGREEKRRKFHEAVLNTLYPPPPSPPPPPPQAVNEEEKPIDTLTEDFQVELINLDDYIRSSNSSGDDDEDDNVDGSECEPQKLTRAQRKRLRKKKLKEDASRRSKIIGPLLPTPNNDDDGGGENVSPSVRQNADEECAVTSDMPREIIGCSDQKKLKNRRKAKKLTRDRLKCSSSKENCSEDQKLKSPNETCDQAHHSCSQD